MELAEEYLTSLDGRHFDSLRFVSGSIRFDLDGSMSAECCRVDITRGDITVTKSSDPADCVVGIDLELMNQLVRGADDAMMALLRGSLTVEGNLMLFFAAARILPDDGVRLTEAVDH